MCLLPYIEISFFFDFVDFGGAKKLVRLVTRDYRSMGEAWPLRLAATGGLGASTVRLRLGFLKLLLGLPCDLEAGGCLNERLSWSLAGKTICWRP